MKIGARRYLSALRRQGVRGGAFDRRRVVRWRLKNGLESRALQAMLYSAETRAVARASLTSKDFLTPPYAALAAVLLEEPDGSPVLERARAALAGRLYLPDPVGHDWAADGLDLVARMVARRERWALERAGGLRPRTDGDDGGPTPRRAAGRTKSIGNRT